MISNKILNICQQVSRRNNIPVTQLFRQFSNHPNFKTEVCSTLDSMNRLPLTELTENEVVMKETVQKLSKEQIGPYVREMEEKGRFNDSVMEMLFQNGLLGIEIEECYGGAGCNFMTTILTVEEISKVDPSVSALVDIHNTLVNSILIKLGTPEQKQNYLPKLAQNMVGSFAITEPSSGSDAFALKTTAKKDGSDYIINGSKMWISNADFAGLFVLFANANPIAGYKGITCFLVDRNLPGVSVGKPEKKLGICASGTCMVSFDNVRVPESAILGELGQGYKYAAGFLNESRIGIAAQQLGLAQGCLDATIPYTLERKQFGQPIFEFQSMQHQIARIATQIESARLLVYNASRMVEAKLPFAKQAAMAKFYASEVAQETCLKCIDWMGGVGFSKDYIQEKFYRDCKIGSIYEGTTNMQLNTIAKHIKKEYQN
ncbi:short/branched chain specific acyl-CoA dehydrogenase, mitochondrial [Harmonia axyridis]|uniref:short/branched chain specific acyl-CoA dehydrogenase, mitochondrial n=1 Tax=Harmonia axyridis TaxID=115357 RepID=UPI001E2769B5|nr:short/branched chain specific acyl-CoA dehydrogenase, mitochondrial [Harmonia axyridis]XP_045464927.1 short/branched chain specific acyl-CoA dehydrogenase, mitochondrial [Harmonia axyridis]